jgi:hypothetical protein
MYFEIHRPNFYMTCVMEGFVRESLNPTLQSHSTFHQFASKQGNTLHTLFKTFLLEDNTIFNMKVKKTYKKDPPSLGQILTIIQSYTEKGISILENVLNIQMAKIQGFLEFKDL